MCRWDRMHLGRITLNDECASCQRRAERNGRDPATGRPLGRSTERLDLRLDDRDHRFEEARSAFASEDSTAESLVRAYSLLAELREEDDRRRRGEPRERVPCGVKPDASVVVKPLRVRTRHSPLCRSVMA